jgi:hypothetical protein
MLKVTFFVFGFFVDCETITVCVISAVLPPTKYTMYSARLASDLLRQSPNREQ